MGGTAQHARICIDHGMPQALAGPSRGDPLKMGVAAGAVGLLGLVVTVEAHGSLVSPPPRNAVDKNLSPWNGPVPNHPPTVESKTGWCPVPDKDGKPSGQNGQACFCREIRSHVPPACLSSISAPAPFSATSPSLTP